MLGWRDLVPPTTTGLMHPPGSDTAEYPPYYYGDLNACAEIGKFVESTDKWHIYGMDLAKVTRCIGPRGGAIQLNGFGYYYLAHATAPQRCEAFLRTFNKWKDNL